MEGHQQQCFSTYRERGGYRKEGALQKKFGGKGNATPDEQVDVRYYGLVFPWAWRVYFGVLCVVSKGNAARRL